MGLDPHLRCERLIIEKCKADPDCKVLLKKGLSWLLLFSCGWNVAWMYNHAEVQSKMEFSNIFPLLWLFWNFMTLHILIYSWMIMNCDSITMICTTSRWAFECTRMLHKCSLCVMCAVCNVYVFSAWCSPEKEVSSSKHDRSYPDSAWDDGQRFRPREVQGQPCSGLATPVGHWPMRTTLSGLDRKAVDGNEATV